MRGVRGCVREAALALLRQACVHEAAANGVTAARVRVAISGTMDSVYEQYKPMR